MLRRPVTRIPVTSILSLQKSQNGLSTRLLRSPVCQQQRTLFEWLALPFSQKELQASMTGNPNIKADWYLVYVGTLAKRIAMYKMGAGFLSVSGIVLAPLVIATAEVPMMALPVALFTFLPLLGYHYLTRKYVLSMHVYIPPAARTDLRTWTTYVNTLPRGTILRLRTFRLVIGIKSHIVPLDELQAVKIEGSIPAFEKNVEWVSTDWRSRTRIFGKKAWFVQHGYGGQEMDVFWRRVGMEESDIKEAREKAVEKMKDYIDKRQKGLKKVLDVIAPETTGGKKGVKVEKKRDKREKKDKCVKKKSITLD